MVEVVEVEVVEVLLQLRIPSRRLLFPLLPERE